MRLRFVPILLGSLFLVGAAAPRLAAQDEDRLQVAAAAKPKLNHRAMERLGWKLSSQAYTFREMSLFETLDVLKALGVRYVELFPGQRVSPEIRQGFDHNASPELVAQVQAKLKANGIKPVCYGVVGIGNDEQEARKVFEFGKKLGLVAITTEPSEDTLPLLDKLSKEYGIGIAIHNHPRPSHYWSPEVVLKAVDGLSKRVGACADTGHWYRSELTPLDCLKQLKGRIVSLHFKDLGEEKHDVPWGTGVTNARGMLEELKRQGFKGVFSIEYEHGSGPELIRNVAKSLAFFSKTAEELAAAR